MWGKAEPTSQGSIQQPQAAKAHQERFNPLPQPEALQQPAAGVGEGVSPPAVGQLRGGEGILQGNGPARLGQGEGRQVLLVGAYRPWSRRSI